MQANSRTDGSTKMQCSESYYTMVSEAALNEYFDVPIRVCVDATLRKYASIPSIQIPVRSAEFYAGVKKKQGPKRRPIAEQQLGFPRAIK